ncbi:polyphosphate polymerase domain-containing protein, partial [Bacteroidota bacterium]
ELEYRTTYYDTPDYEMYTAHHNGKLNRFKIRTREYMVSKIHFLEVKFKNNKGRTLKERVRRIDGDLEFHENETAFLADSAPYTVDDLIPKLWNHFIRLTLVHKSAQERLTIDFNLSFKNEKNEEAEVPQLSIIEVKQDKYTADSEIIKVLRKYHINETRISKYCIGTAMLNPWIKRNRFKIKLLAIDKLN